MDNCKDASEWFSWGQRGKMVELQRKNGMGGNGLVMGKVREIKVIGIDTC